MELVINIATEDTESTEESFNRLVSMIWCNGSAGALGRRLIVQFHLCVLCALCGKFFSFLSKHGKT
jgi:hypothetical protein